MAICYEARRWICTDCKIIESFLQRLIVMPAGHDDIVIVSTYEPAFSQFVGNNRFVNDVVKSAATDSPYAQIDHSGTQRGACKRGYRIRWNILRISSDEQPEAS
jgi:hypothetical protein